MNSVVFTAIVMAFIFISHIQLVHMNHSYHAKPRGYLPTDLPMWSPNTPSAAAIANIREEDSVESMFSDSVQEYLKEYINGLSVNQNDTDVVDLSNYYDTSYDARTKRIEPSSSVEKKVYDDSSVSAWSAWSSSENTYAAF